MASYVSTPYENVARQGMAWPSHHWTWGMRDWINNYVKDNPIQWVDWEKPEGWDDRPVRDPNAIYRLSSMAGGTRPNFRPAEEPLFQRDKAWDSAFNEAVRSWAPRPHWTLGPQVGDPRSPWSKQHAKWQDQWDKGWEGNPNFGAERFGGWLPRHESNPVRRPYWYEHGPRPDTGGVTGTDTDTTFSGEDGTDYPLHFPFGGEDGTDYPSFGDVTDDPISNNESIIRNSINKPRVTSQTFR